MNSWARGESSGQLGRRRLLIGFGICFAVILGVAGGVAALSAPGPRATLCQPYRPCGAPPTLPKPLVNEELWHSPDFGFSVEYPGDQLSVAAQGGSGVALKTSNGRVLLGIQGRPAEQGSLSAAISAELDALKSNVLGLASDTDAANALLGSNVGHRGGRGRSYVGYLAGPQGVRQPVRIAIQSASDGAVTITVTAVIASADPNYIRGVYQLADAVFNTVTWRAQSRGLSG